ncbi:MAG: biotin--[acetyl-CoA-carboxylase] ligase, partial [bacterium (Candidatus Stahlbacteria) CG08_land_8_20_14_0_20_40_26]
MMDIDRIYGSRLFTKEKFLFYKRLPSTQDRAKELIKNGVGRPGYVIVADEQYRGRGRFRRVWSSHKGESLTFSFITEKIPLLSMRTALSVAKTLEEECGLRAEIEWPNDIVIGNKKICGILIETERELAIIGVGMNVNETVLPLESATSVRIETGIPASREAILSLFLSIFESNLTRENIMDCVREYLSFMDRYVEIETENGVVRGEFINLGEDGEIIIRTESGSIASFLPGEAKRVHKLTADARRLAQTQIKTVIKS